MIKLDAGTFFMGSNSSLMPDHEKPLLDASVKAFEIDQYEVSRDQYEKCVDKGQCPKISREPSYPTSGSLPQTMITWSEAVTYCKWVGGHLPTEAQWEYASRGKFNTEYPWGTKLVNEDLKGIQVGHISYPAIKTSPLPVQSKSKNIADADPSRMFRGGAFGVYHLAGNVSEWTRDATTLTDGSPSPLKLTDLQQKKRQIDNPKFEDGDARIYKGADYQIIFPRLQRASFRRAAAPNYFSPNLGFRCVIDNP